MDEEEFKKIDKKLFGKKGKDDTYEWNNRRVIIYLTLLFCGWCIYYILMSGLDLQIYGTIALGAFTLAASIIGAYVFGRTWEHLNMRKIQTIETAQAERKLKETKQDRLDEQTPKDER